MSLPSKPRSDSPKVSLSLPTALPTTQRTPGRPSVRNESFSSSYGLRHSTTFRDNAINNAGKIRKRVVSTFKKMSLLQRLLAGLGLVALATLGILFLVFNEKIFGLLEPVAERWKNTTGGWTILWALTFITAFPPILGYSSCGTIAGFVYGVGEGWLIFASATIVGSTCSFLLSRTILRKYVERLVAHDKRFAALTLTLQNDGLKLLCMIRLCPLPYSLSNGAMSTFPTVSPSMYAAATALITPKLFIHVFIGSRLAAIAKSGEEMSMGARAVNWASIMIGATVGAFTGWYIYKKTMARAAELEAEEINNVRDSVRRTDLPPQQFSDDPEAQVAANTLAEEDDVEFFDDDEDTSGPEQRGYRDEATDDEEDVFEHGHGVDDDAISLKKQSRGSF